jgi:hypothetical protein
MSERAIALTPYTDRIESPCYVGEDVFGNDAKLIRPTNGLVVRVEENQKQ